MSACELTMFLSCTMYITEAARSSLLFESNLEKTMTRRAASEVTVNLALFQMSFQLARRKSLPCLSAIEVWPN